MVPGVNPTIHGVGYDPGTNIHVDVHVMEKLWAKEMYELSVKDREIINNELHGASESNVQANRDAEWSEQQYFFYLNNLQKEIDTKVRLEDKQTYLEALDLGSSYITSPEFRLGFLRAERYDVEKAAIRYCRCLDFLAEFFGKDALLRPLLMSDLTKKELRFLREGYIQVLPSRDRLGRRILAQLGSYGGTNYSEIEKFRVAVYLCFTVLAEDVTTQRLGVVSLSSFTRGAETSMLQEMKTISKLVQRFFAVVPLRWTAAHVCFPGDPVYHLMKALVLHFLGVNGRKMTRVHIGTPMECDYKLRSFGIPTDDIPRTNTNTIKLKNHTRLIKVRKVIDAFVKKSMETDEAKNIPFPGIECPEVNCVLFGRYAWDYPGNIEFRGLLREMVVFRKDQNSEASDQTHLTIKSVIDESRSRNFRFLVYDRSTFFYKEVTEYEEIWALVDQSVREHRKRIRAKRMIEETKFAIQKSVDGNTHENVSGMNTSSIIGHQRNRVSKFMKDCNGCRCFVNE